MLPDHGSLGCYRFLEAVYLLMNQGNPFCLSELLEDRGELAEARATAASLSGAIEYQVEHIFHGHFGHNVEPDKWGTPNRAIVVRSQHERALSLQVQLSAEGLNTVPPSLAYRDRFPSDVIGNGVSPLYLVFRYSEPAKPIGIPVRGDFTVPAPLLQSRRQPSPYRFITTTKPDFARLAELWNNITLTLEEDHVVGALRILEPAVEGIRFLSRQTPNSGVVIKLKGQPGPVPLGSMGGGMGRMLALVMSAVVSEDGVLLVDEIDTGLYHGAQTDMWRLLIETAQRLNVQIFATTHSWDCVEAFQEALAQSNDEAVGRLFRLEGHDGDIRAVTYSDRELAVAVRQAIEVR